MRWYFRPYLLSFMHAHFGWILGLVVLIVYFLALTTEADPEPHPCPLPPSNSGVTPALQLSPLSNGALLHA